MSRTLTDPSGGNTINRVLPIYNGGSEEITAPDALLAFNGVPASEYNQPNGVASLNSAGKLPFNILPDSVSSSVAVIGPTLLYLGSKGQWAITNYDNRIQYTVTASAGFISRSDDIVYFTAPITPQVVTINIGDKEFTVEVSERYIQKPEILSPLPEATNIGSGFIAQTDSFTIQGGYQKVLLNSSDIALGDTFGIAVAITPDGSRLVIGANGANISNLNDAGAAYVFRNDSGTWVEEAKLHATNLQINAYLGYSVAIDDAGLVIVLGAYGYDNGGYGDAGAIYIFTRTGSTWSLTQGITPPDPITSGVYGLSVAISGDGAYILIGCYIRGAAYMYTLSGGTWTLNPQFALFDHHYGTSVDINYDGTRIIIGANAYNAAGLNDSGGIFVYTRSGSVWTQETILVASDPVVSGRLGMYSYMTPDSMRVISTGNSDTAKGSYIFVRSGTTWTQEAKLVPWDVTLDLNFGIYSTLSDDGQLAACAHTPTRSLYIFKREGSSWLPYLKIEDPDNDLPDGFSYTAAFTNDNSKLVISTLTEGVYVYDMSYHASTDWELSTDPAFTNIVQQSLADTINLKSWPVSDLTLDTDYYLRSRYTGTQYGTSEWSETAHVHTRQSWLPVNETKILTASDKAASDQFGIKTAVTADGSRLVVVANAKTVSGVTQCGCAYIYRFENGQYIEEQIISASDKVAGDAYGTAVAINDAGDLIVVGSPFSNPGSLNDAGKIYTYTRSGTVWTEESIFSAADKAAGDYFGFNLALTPDNTRLVVSAYLKDYLSNIDIGYTYIYTRSGATWVLEVEKTASDWAASSYLSSSISITDAGDRVLAGSNGSRPLGLSLSGQAYVFRRDGTTWVEERKFSAPTPQTGAQFGAYCHINSDGSRVAIAAYLEDNVQNDSGRVYIYTRSDTTWTLEATIQPSDITTGQYFGFNVKLSDDGSLLFVGSAYKTVNGLVNAGCVYIFKRTGSTWTQEAMLTSSNPNVNAYLGAWFSIVNDKQLLVSAQGDSSSGLVNSGAVYIFQ